MPVSLGKETITDLKRVHLVKRLSTKKGTFLW